MEKLQQCGNLLSYIKGDCDIQILRVYGYESRPCDDIYKCLDESRLPRNLENLFSTVWKNIPMNWRDNKIVVEVQIGPWRLFLGYWDWSRTIGFGVIPNMYMPHVNLTKLGRVEPINIKRK